MPRTVFRLHLQRRDLQLRGVAPRAEKDGYRFRSTGDTEVLLAAYATWGTSYPRPSERHVRVRCLRPVVTGAVLCPGPVGGQAIRLRLRRPAIRLRLRAQGADHIGPVDATVSPAEHLPRIRRPRLCLLGRRYLLEDIRSLPPGHALHIGADRQERIWQWWRPGCEPAERDGAAEKPRSIRQM